MKQIVFCLICFSSFLVQAAEKVTFITDEGVKITADVYLENKEAPYILLLHQANSSRGEYIDIAPRLLKLGFNCIAVDLRSGGKVNYLENETAGAQVKWNNTFHVDRIITDIESALNFTKTYTRYPVLLVGSAQTASLALLIAEKNKQVEAVVAFHPGEYFQPDVYIKEEITELRKPVFVSSSKQDYSYTKSIFTSIPDKYLTFYQFPENSDIGAKALWPEQPGADACWFQLLMFLNQFK